LNGFRGKTAVIGAFVAAFEEYCNNKIPKSCYNLRNKYQNCRKSFMFEYI